MLLFLCDAEGQASDGRNIVWVLNSWNLKEVLVVREEYHASIFEADEEWRLVYGVVAEFDMMGAQGDMMSSSSSRTRSNFTVCFQMFDERSRW